MRPWRLRCAISAKFGITWYHLFRSRFAPGFCSVARAQAADKGEACLGRRLGIAAGAPENAGANPRFPNHHAEKVLEIVLFQ
jgi:hypothetical protein